MPATRVIKHLGHLSELELENLRTSLEASKRGKKVVVTRARVDRPPKVAANLRYLDLAVLLETWRAWELGEFIDDLLPVGDAVVAPSVVVAALVMQRCVAAGSKLRAARWFPQTALPELLGVAPSNFNNTRLHRVLDDLDQCGVDLMAKLPRRYVGRNGAFAAMFLDVTDTWFVGHGPDMAQRAKTKEGIVQRKVGIVLLCNERGYPLRWEVIRGKESDKESMTRSIQSISGLSWVGETPVVCDRSMGSTKQIRQLLNSKVRFLTALCRSEFSAYSDAVPHESFTELTVEQWSNAKQRKSQAMRVGQLAQSAGMTKVDDRLYVLDLGVIQRQEDSVSAEAQLPPAGQTEDPVVEAMRLGRRVREAVASGQADSFAAAGRMIGLSSKGQTSKYRRLTRLSEDIQLEVLDGKARGTSIGELLKISEQSDFDLQRQAFEALLEHSAARGGKHPRHVSKQPPQQNTPRDKTPVRVRGVVYFNPEMFVDQRRSAQQRLADIEAFTGQLNRRLQSSRAKMTKAKILAEVDRKLRGYELLEAYNAEVDEVDGRFSVRVMLKQDEWTRRRRYDGFSFLVAHPETQQHSGQQLCLLYRAKDIVEKDFETIKSFVELRPVRHRLDAKVRAHVTICMLSLLLERSLNEKLGDHLTAQRALEELSSCHLNRYNTNGASDAYDVTELSDNQQAILRQLRLQRLAQTDEVLDRITPR
jgi:hypothetical protein